MLDFVRMSINYVKQGEVEIEPKFKIQHTEDLMIRGGDFYAVWDEKNLVWSTNELDVVNIVDRSLDEFYEQNKDRFPNNVQLKYMWDASSGVIDKWHKFCQKQLRDTYTPLDEKIMFSNMTPKKTDYSSKRLSYPLTDGPCPAYDKLISTLYDPEERHKIEWCIGSIVNGDSRKIQKFCVLYGSGGTGKSTVLNIVESLFKPYCTTFDAKALGSSTNSFALESFSENPLVAIQHDGDLSKIEDNTRINSLVSHEKLIVNEKYKTSYANSFKAFLFMGTNKPVKITDAKSGIIRRLIDVKPSGRKLDSEEYDRLVSQIKFELGCIASHCLKVYEADPRYYDTYIPSDMMGATNDFYNFVLDYYFIFKNDDQTTLMDAWAKYNVYCEETNVIKKLPRIMFKEELKNYFNHFQERTNGETRIRSLYTGFKYEKFTQDKKTSNTNATDNIPDFLNLSEQESKLDISFGDSKAQYATSNGTPYKSWNSVKTTLSDIDTRKLHYMKPLDEHHIVIDFDEKNDDGDKSLALNIEAAKDWVPTYAEVSKSGNGLHLHYIYDGDVSKLSSLFSENVEIKLCTGGSSFRRQLSKCNNYDVAHINSGLPFKKEANKTLDNDIFKNEKAIRTMIKRCIAKEYHGHTKPNIDYIDHILTEAYNSGTKYDVRNLKASVLIFAMSSSHNSDYCIKKVEQMHFSSDEDPDPLMKAAEPKIAFFDTEVFPNLFVLNWKYPGEDMSVVRMINPTADEVRTLVSHLDLIGFNNKRYDNHILYARMMNYTNEMLYKLSKRLISGDRSATFLNANNLSYTDVYDFAAAPNKDSLKKWEIKLKIHHKELGLSWDEPVPEEKWTLVAEYCDNDVIATEKTFIALESDWIARKLLTDLAKSNTSKPCCVNDSTNDLTTKFVIGDVINPQREYLYRDLSQPVRYLDPEVLDFLKEACPEMMNQKHGPENSLLPYFPGYTFKNGVSMYRDVKVGEGGCVTAEPGMYGDVALLDIASMHPHSTIAECLFGPRFTRRFREIVEGRVGIKHEAWSDINNMLNGVLTPYIEQVKQGEITSKDLANALKTAINSIYGLTSAHFPNAFKDSRNVDNIVAKRGALFMLDLKDEVEKRGFTVAHIKTDSIKIPDATPEIIKFVMDFGKIYGYTFEHEATYEKMCLVNNSVYIAKFANADKCESMYGYIPDDNRKKGGTWSATGKQFAVPYVFKTLFSHEPIEFDDLCETKQVQTAIYLDMNESLPDVSAIENERSKILKQIKKDESYEFGTEDRIAKLDDEISKGHDYQFVGKVGLFCPIIPGKGGGELVRIKGDKYDSVNGAKDYRWLEAETVLESGMQEFIDRRYHNDLVSDARDKISKYGDFEWLVSDDPYIGPMSEYMNEPR